MFYQNSVSSDILGILCLPFSFPDQRDRGDCSRVGDNHGDRRGRKEGRGERGVVRVSPFGFKGFQWFS